MREPILACYSDSEDVYFVPDAENPALDGIVVRDDEEFEVPFWSYVSRNPGMTEITDDEYLDELWNGDRGAREWQEEYFWHGTRVQDD